MYGIALGRAISDNNKQMITWSELPFPLHEGSQAIDNIIRNPIKRRSL